MLSEIDRFVNWVRRRNPEARTWKDYAYDLRQFAALVGDNSGKTARVGCIDACIFVKEIPGIAKQYTRSFYKQTSRPPASISGT
jgi:hypothetical protein